MQPTLLIVCLLLFCISFGQDGTLDFTYGNDGSPNDGKSVFQGLTIMPDKTGMAVQSDGKVIVVGSALNGNNYDFGIVRFSEDGAPDLSFGDNGKVLIPVGDFEDIAHSVMLQSDSKIIIAGRAKNNSNYYDVAIVRLNSDGTLDNTFDQDGKAIIPIGIPVSVAYSIVLQPNGKILLTGGALNGSYEDIYALRVNSDGILDDTFDGDGVAIISLSNFSDNAHTIALLPNGKILLAGYAEDNATNDIAIVRLNSNGTIDTDFGGMGKVIIPVGSSYDYAYSISIQLDGKILLGGWGFSSSGFDDIVAVRLNNNGTFDENFGSQGKLMLPVGPYEDQAYSVAVQQDGKILLSGHSEVSGSTNDENVSIIRLNADGTIDNNFASSGIALIPIGSFEDLAYSLGGWNETIYLSGLAKNSTGQFEFFVVRLLNSSPITLPLKLLDFSVLKANGVVNLKWQTLQEDGTSHFILERSADSRIYTRIGEVPASGFSSSIVNYSFKDARPLKGKNFYRLKMVDIDGKSIYSKSVMVVFDALNTVFIYPNPVTEYLRVEMDSEQYDEVNILDMVGRVLTVQKIASGQNIVKIYVGNLPTGIYNLIVSNRNKQKIFTFVRK